MNSYPFIKTDNPCGNASQTSLSQVLASKLSDLVNISIVQSKMSTVFLFLYFLFFSSPDVLFKDFKSLFSFLSSSFSI